MNTERGGNGVWMELYRMNTAPLADPERFARCLAAVSPQRQEKVRALRLEKDRRRSLAAALLLRHRLRQMGLYEHRMHYTLNAYGKPCLAECPQLHFSLSHGGEEVLAAFSDADVGCDLEPLAKANLAVARRFFHPEEAAFLFRQPGDAGKQEAFFRLWTCKESYCKLRGLGLHLPMDRFAVRLEKDGPPRIVENGAEIPVRMREYDAVPGCRAACCSFLAQPPQQVITVPMETE